MVMQDLVHMEDHILLLTVHAMITAKTESGQTNKALEAAFADSPYYDNNASPLHGYPFPPARPPPPPLPPPPRPPPPPSPLSPPPSS